MAHTSPTGFGYALAMLQRAWAAVARGDAERPEARVAAWEAVLSGMTEGRLDVGARAPVVGVPAWVTPEVVHGGFATSRLRAELPLDAAEVALLAAWDRGEGTPRGRLNGWWVSEAGIAALLARLDGGAWRVDVPEQAALAVVAWLVRAGRVSQAAEVVVTLAPWFDRLAFSPRLAEQPEPPARGVRRASAAAVAEALRQVAARPGIEAMRRSLAALPVVDRAVALWCETVDGPLPRLEDGRVVGGSPGARWPAGWSARGAAVLAASEALVVPGRHAHRRSNHQTLIRALRVVLAEGEAALDRRALGRVRRALANDLTARGAPGSPARASLRAAQAATLARPPYAALRRVVAARLDVVGPERGLVDPDALAVPVAAGEEDGEVPAGAAVPGVVRAKLELAREAPLEELVARGVVGSAEVLASLLPQVAARALWSGVGDPTLARLLEATYRAFRARRSVLLLDLQHQVRFEELPWVAAVADLGGGAAASGAALHEVVALALRSFPATPTPDGLVRELGALAKAAGVALDLTEGLAADIFQGAFTSKWTRSAAAAARRLEATLYSRYYDLPAWGGVPPSEEAFAALCRARAREAGEARGGVAVNGAIIEQSEILTTRNLVALVELIGIPALGDPAPLAACALREAIARLAARRRTPGMEGAVVRQAAGSWRQGVCFLSLCDAPEAVIACLPDPPDPGVAAVVAGLRHVAAGGRFGPDGRAVGGEGRRLLGWSVGPHWMA